MGKRRYTVKVDGSFHNEKESGIGVMIHDKEKGRYFFSIKTNCKNSFQCEKLAVSYALYKLKELNINEEVTILSDNKKIIYGFRKRYNANMKNVAFGWIPRNQNKVAHRLARKAAKGEIMREFVPKWIIEDRCLLMR
jgi:ribonuclease HI